MTRRFQAALLPLVFATSILAAPNLAAERKKIDMPNPDFTQGGKTDGSHDWTLGATGARGWMYARKHTAEARQILVTLVAARWAPLKTLGGLPGCWTSLTMS
jgi:hypothetical protein